MKHRPLLPAMVVLGASALAQDALRPRLHPITSPIRRAGVFHVATGTWTRNSSLANLTGPDTIYNNTCSPVYFGAQIDGEKWQHRSRVPSPTGPTTDSQSYPGPNAAHENDEHPGCQTSYAVNGFEVAYCSSKPSGAGTITYVHQFASSYTACGASDMIPDVTFTLTGLPGGTASGAQLCWVVQVDLDAASESFVLAADGDGTYTGTSEQNTFGWSFGPVASVSSADVTGPIVAGNYTASFGQFVPCTGTDGTIWDSPIDQPELGTGMSSQSFFRITGTTTAPLGTGCYFFQSHVDFYLKLFADTGCEPPFAMEPFCLPGQSGVITCPCNNPPSSDGKGCNNFGGNPAPSCQLFASGVGSVSNDTLILTSSGENNGAFTIFLQAPSSNSTGFVYGAGVRCIAGSLKRMFNGAATPGSSISRPAPGDPTVTQRSAALGDPLAAGFTRFYMTYYRDPQASGPCSNAASTFNCSNSGKVTWLP